MIENVNKLKICGIYFSESQEIEKNNNVNDKIKKQENQLKPWISRVLSIEGKILLVKTFGLSQLIYNMQCTEFDLESLKEVEGKIFNFIWSKSNAHNSSRSIDRIIRTVLKNDYPEGGLKAPDVECL
jgi:hypothetical protein